MITIASAPDGVTVMLHTSSPPSTRTRAAAVTMPPVTISAWSRMFAALVATASSNEIWNVNAV